MCPTVARHAQAHARLCTAGSPLHQLARMSHVASRHQRAPSRLPGAFSGATVFAATLQPEELTAEQHRVAIFVEPSPFSHVSGMKNRFECLIQGLRAAGDHVMVFTPDSNPPQEYFGAKVVSVLGFRLPFYEAPTLLLSLGISIRVLWHLILRRPDVIHASSPGPMVFASILYAKLLAIPLVVSYHTHIPEYIPRYTWSGLVQPMWSLIRFASRMADLTLVTSKVMKDELTRNRCAPGSLDVWQRGVDTQLFHPRHRSSSMRSRMSGGHPDDTILVYVGRLGAEKNLFVLRDILVATPSVRLCFVGDGPTRAELERHFAGTRTTFLGQVQGGELHSAYASADIFLMPSESETLGFVVLEAMASGLPVVAVAAGGLTDILTSPGKTGFLYPTGDYAAAARLTQQLVSDPELRCQVGRAARQEVEAWGWTASTNRLRTQQYRTAINSYKSKQLWRPLREIVALLLQRILSLVELLFCGAVHQLDYARSFRSFES